MVLGSWCLVRPRSLVRPWSLVPGPRTADYAPSVHEARVRRPPLRRRHRRRLRGPLPADRRAPCVAARRHDYHDLRQGSHYVAKPLSGRRDARGRAARAAGSPWRASATCGASWSSTISSPRTCATVDQQEQWFRENGPDAPELLAHLRRHGADYDRVLFWSYRYADTYFGLPLAADRAVLVPTAEEDPLIHVDTLDAFFALPKGFLFLTPEEETLVAPRMAAGKPTAVIGSGLDPAPASVDLSPLDPLGLDDPFVLYLGRIDPEQRLPDACPPLLALRGDRPARAARHGRACVDGDSGASRDSDAGLRRRSCSRGAADARRARS